MDIDVDRLRHAVREWVNTKPPPRILSIIKAGEEGGGSGGLEEVDDGLHYSTRVQGKAVSVVKRLRDSELKDYHARRREYTLNRHPTPPPPEIANFTPRRPPPQLVGVHHAGDAEADAAAAAAAGGGVAGEKGRGGHPSTAPQGRGGGGGRAGAQRRQSTANRPWRSDMHLPFQKRHYVERHTAVVPKLMLRKEIFNTEAKIVFYRCGGHTNRSAASAKPEEEAPAAARARGPKAPAASAAASAIAAAATAAAAAVQPPPAQVVLTCGDLPSYNGTYTLAPAVAGVAAQTGAGSAPTTGEASAAAAGGPSLSWRCGTRRIRKVAGRWRVEDAAYRWVEAAHPHGGRQPTECAKWDCWDPDASRWTYDAACSVSALGAAGRREAAPATAVSVAAPAAAPEYGGVYTLLEQPVDGQPAWGRGTRVLSSHEGYWCLQDAAYAYAEAAAPTTAPHPLSTSDPPWDRWDGHKRAWVATAVTLRCAATAPPAAAAAAAATRRRTVPSLLPTPPPPQQPPPPATPLMASAPRPPQLSLSLSLQAKAAETGVSVGGAPAFLTQPKAAESNAEDAAAAAAAAAAADSAAAEAAAAAAEPAAATMQSSSEELLADFLPPVDVPSYTLRDILTGRVLKRGRRGRGAGAADGAAAAAGSGGEGGQEGGGGGTAAAAVTAAEAKPQDETNEAAREVEALLFGYHGGLKMHEAQRVLGLTYRFIEDGGAGALAPMPDDFARFERAYADEKALFHQRCIKELKRISTQRRAHYGKKRRILNDILKKVEKGKTSNARWRNASTNLQRQMFNDVEREFRAKRRSLLRLWMAGFRAALPQPQPPCCKAVLSFLDGLFSAHDLRLTKDTFYQMCNDVLSSHHVLLNDTVRLLWCAKRIFQVSDEQFCDLVRAKTRMLCDYNLAHHLPPLAQDGSSGGAGGQGGAAATASAPALPSIDADL